MSLCCNTCRWDCLTRPRRSVSRPPAHVRSEASIGRLVPSLAQCVRPRKGCCGGEGVSGTGRKRPAKVVILRVAVPGAGGCPLRPVKPGFHAHIHTAGQHPLVPPSPPCLSCARSSSSCREKQQVCRLRGFWPRKLSRPFPRHVTSQFQRHRCCAQLPPAFVSHATSYLEGSSKFRAASLAQGQNMTSRTPRTLCHLGAIVRPRRRVVAPTKGLAAETLQPSGAISRQTCAAPCSPAAKHPQTLE